MIQYDGITIRDIGDTSAHSDEAQFAALPSGDVSVDIVTDNKFITSIKILLLGVLIVCSFILIRLCAAFISPIVYLGDSVFSILRVLIKE